MIIFSHHAYEDCLADNAILFGDEDLPKLIKVLERGLNTISPPEPYLDLIKLLDELRCVKNG